MMHHRDPEFGAIFARVRRKLAWVFGTSSDVIVLAGTGTLAMEAAVTHFVHQGDTALYVDSGKFGARFGEILRAFGVRAVAIEAPLGQAVSIEAVQAALAAHPEARALYVQGCETSTGVSHPVAQLAQLCRRQPDCLCIVDGITQVAIEPLPMDALGIDVLLGATQKSFMMSAGLSFVGVSARGWRRAEGATLPRFYADLVRERRAAHAGHTAWTSAVSLWYGLDVALQLMEAEGLEERYARHRALAEHCRHELLAMGCEAFAQPPAQGLTVVRPPPGVDAHQVIATLQRDHHMRIGGGQDALAGQILRIAHMGDVDLYDLTIVLHGLKTTLAALQRS
jgi:aspartate aminotransferase-like enzyme